MNWFYDLFSELSETPESVKRKELVFNFFRESDPDEKMHGLFLLLGGKIKRPVSSRKLKNSISNYTGLSDWLVLESNKSTGNLAETLTLIFDDPSNSQTVSLRSIFLLIESCRNLSDEDFRDLLFTELSHCNRSQRLLIFQLLCGSFKPVFNSGQVIALFAKANGFDSVSLIHPLSEKWHPDTLSFNKLNNLLQSPPELTFPVPIPPLTVLREISGLQNPTDWLAEWKPSGHEIQLVKQSGKVFLFDGEGSPVFKKYLDLGKAGQSLPDGTILSGILVNSAFSIPNEFSEKNSGKNYDPGAHPKEKSQSTLICTDILAYQNSQFLEKSFKNRRLILENCLREHGAGHFLLPESIDFTDWNDLTALIEMPIPMGIDGILLRDSKQLGFSSILLLPKPQSIKAVLLYVQASAGSKQGTNFDLSLAVWNKEALTSIAKISHSFSVAESKELARFIKENTLERFGPVRTVNPELVFEIEFDSAEPSARHKSGLVLKNPKILGWDKESGKNEAGSLFDLEKMAKKSLHTRGTEA